MSTTLSAEQRRVLVALTAVVDNEFLFWEFNLRCRRAVKQLEASGYVRLLDAVAGPRSLVKLTIAGRRALEKQGT